MFTFGYWGWGNATEHLVSLVDSVERERGFARPIFVDIRIRRTVRAAGFNGNAFGDVLGGERYVHIPSLGNLAILGHPGPAIQIKAPAEAAKLLDLARQAAHHNRRVIFFCACEYPGLEGHDGACHRTTVGGLLLREARRRQVPIEVVEWPGGKGRLTDLALPGDAARKLLRGGKSIPLGSSLPTGQFAGIPPGSIVRVHSPATDVSVMVGRLLFGRGGWHLPVVGEPALGDEAATLLAKAPKWRRKFGFEARLS